MCTICQLMHSWCKLYFHWWKQDCKIIYALRHSMSFIPFLLMCVAWFAPFPSSTYEKSVWRLCKWIERKQILDSSMIKPHIYRYKILNKNHSSAHALMTYNQLSFVKEIMKSCMHCVIPIHSFFASLLHWFGVYRFINSISLLMRIHSHPLSAFYPTQNNHK